MVIHTLPPWLVPRSDGRIREDGIFAEGGHYIGIRLLIGSRRNTEKSCLGIDRVQVTVRADLQPGDVVADGTPAIALVFERRNHHGKVRFSAGRWERRRPCR